MISQTFEFERYTAEHLSSGWHGSPAQSFDRLAVRGCVSNRSVAAQGFDQVNRTFSRPADKRGFDAAMLVAERYFQVENTFAVTLEAKMAWFYDSCMYGTDGDFMNFFSADSEKFGRFGKRNS